MVGNKMTMFSTQQIDEMRKIIVGKTVISLEYDDEDDYFIMEFKDKVDNEEELAMETTFRFMRDLES